MTVRVPMTNNGHAPTARRAIALVAVLALALAGCDASNASSRPSNGLPDITPAPLASRGPATPRPSGVCPTELGPTFPEASIEFMGPVGSQGSGVTLERITRLRDGGVVYEDNSDNGTWDAGWVTGGMTLTFALTLNPSPRPAIELVEMIALYHPPGDGSWTPVALEPAGSDRSMAIPDAAGGAQLRLTSTWTDGCFTYRGSARFAFEIVPAAVVAACPSDEATLRAILEAHQDDQFVVGDVTRPIGTLSYRARYSSFNAADQVGQFGSWDPAARTLDAATGELLAAADDDADLLVAEILATFYRLPDPDATTPDGAVVVGTVGLLPDLSGRFQIESPEDEGRYILEVSTNWELDCLLGQGMTYFTVDVHPVVGSLPRPSV